MIHEDELIKRFCDSLAADKTISPEFKERISALQRSDAGKKVLLQFLWGNDSYASLLESGGTRVQEVSKEGKDVVV